MFSLFKKKEETRDILIPDEEFALVSSTYDGLPAVGSRYDDLHYTDHHCLYLFPEQFSERYDGWCGKRITAGRRQAQGTRGCLKHIEDTDGPDLQPGFFMSVIRSVMLS